MSEDTEYCHIGSVQKPHGIQGDFVVFLESDFPEWLVRQKRFFVQPQGQKNWVPWQVLKARLHQGKLVLKLDGLADRTAVEAARGTPLYVLEEEARAAAEDPDFFFNSDLVGLEMWDGPTAMGEVSAVYEMPAHNLIEVTRPDGKTFLVPFTQEHVADIDLEQGRLQVTLPEGLVDIND